MADMRKRLFVELTPGTRNGAPVLIAYGKPGHKSPLVITRALAGADGANVHVNKDGTGYVMVPAGKRGRPAAQRFTGSVAGFFGKAATSPRKRTSATVAQQDAAQDAPAS